MLLGLWVCLLLFLGFPESWDKVIAIATGVVIFGISYSFGTKSASNDKDRVNFVESKRINESGPLGSSNVPASGPTSGPTSPSQINSDIRQV